MWQFFVTSCPVNHRTQKKMLIKYSEKLKKDLAERHLGPSTVTEKKSVPGFVIELFKFTSIEKSQKHSTCDLFFFFEFFLYIYIFFFKWRKGKIIPLRPKGKQKKGKSLVTRYISHEKSHPSNDETKNNPPSTKKKNKGDYYLTSFFFFLTRYFSLPRKVPGKKTDSVILWRMWMG